MSFDRRETPVNDRVVAAWLADRFPDRTPVDPVMHYVAVPVLDLSLTCGGARDRQLLYGEPFEVFDTRDGFAFGLSVSANYVGWVRVDALTPEDRPDPVLWVTARQTHAYSAPDFKSPEILALSLLSIVSPTGQEGRFTGTELGWIPTIHLGATEEDPVAVAERYLGTPYLWGGNSCWGIDCSGLVKAALGVTGTDCPGDSDLQCARLGQTLDPNTAPQRGDLMFWKGHVAMVTDADTLIHANAYHMAVTHEPIDAAIRRIAAQGDGDPVRHARLTQAAT